jgi:cytochrome c556
MEEIPMRKVLMFPAIAATLTVGMLFAQSDADYQGWMKAIAGSNGAMGKAIEAKNGAAAAAEAQKLEGLFKQVEEFWQKRNTADAVNFAKQAQGVAMSVMKSANAGNFDQAAMEAKSIGAACGGCHMAHRERTDAGFIIK